MARWLPLWLIVCCGCALPLADYGQRIAVDEPVTTTLVERHSSTQEAASPSGRTTNSSAHSQASAAAKVSDTAPTAVPPAPHAAASAPQATPATAPATVRAAGFGPADPAELERVISPNDLKLSPEYQEFLRMQVLAVLAQQTPMHQTPARQTAAQASPTQLTPQQLAPEQLTPVQHSALASPLLPVTNPLSRSAVDVGMPLPGPDVSGQLTQRDSTPRRLSSQPVSSRSENPGASPADTRGVSDLITSAAGVTNTLSPKNLDALPDASADRPNSVPADDLTPGKWRESLEIALADLQKELARFPHEDHDAATLAAYVRLLHVISNHSSAAVAAIDKMPDGEREYWKHQLLALLHVLDADQKNPTTRRFALALRELRTAVDELSNASALDVRNLAFCQDVDSFGCYTEFRTHAFKPGQEVLLYVEVENFAVEPVREKFETALQGEYAIVSDKNIRITHAELPFVEQTCNNRLRDYFIAYTLHLPKDIPPGQYTLQLTLEDLKGHKSGNGSLDFGIR